MSRRTVARPFLLWALLAAFTPLSAVEPHAGMLRYPDVSESQIAFLYANDLWVVSKDGGTATPLASPPGEETFPRFSPDGKTIAFVGNYDGDTDLYTVPVTGGVPFRVTHHPAAETLTDWTADGRLIFYAGGVEDYPRAQELFTVASSGGLPEKLPVPYGANGRISPNGEWLAYTPHSRDFRTWKRYRGGMATDIWLFNLDDMTSRKITEWEGTDTQPMWQGNRVYYLSDAGPTPRLNIWVYDVDTGERRQITRHKDFDAKWPSIGPGSDGQGEIVYQLGAELRLLDLGSEKSRPVTVTIPGARPKLRPQIENAFEFTQGYNISSTGKRVLLEARGDVWTVAAKHGSPRNLTRTSGSAERNPAWSPDGKWIVFASDHTGEYELYLTKPDGLSEPTKLTDLAPGYIYGPSWSPDSKKIAFWDQSGRLYIHDIDAKSTREIDQAPANGRSTVSWSSDSGWLAWARGESPIRKNAIWLYDVNNETKHRVTAGMFNDTWPAFDREGKYLYFTSQREFTRPKYEDVGTTWIYSETDRLYVVPLSAETDSPLAPKTDEEGADEADAESEKGEADESDEAAATDDQAENGDDVTEDEPGEKEEKEDKVEPVKIDLDGFEHRAVLVPVKRGNLAMLYVNDENKLIYGRFAARGEEGKASIHLLNLDADKPEEREKTVVAEVDGYVISADGKKLLVVKDRSAAIVDTRPDQKLENMVSTDGMMVQIDPREEWRQIFNEAWRIQRDFFYDPNMHGVDWKKVRRQYEPMLADCASREDVSYVIREMISELNVGHAYYFGGDVEDEPQVSVGMLGARFELDQGAYRISGLYEGGPWDIDARGPLSQPGIDAKVGDYLLAVNGVPVDSTKDPWAAFQGMAGRTVTMTFSERPELDDAARQVVVELLPSQADLVYRAWVEKNRAYVAERTGGRVGYIYVPNTGIEGQNELVRQFFAQHHLDALIIDERWNGGGQIPTRFVELLNRPIANYWALRGDDVFPWPPDSHQGPKCMLINGLAGSGGDYFPFWFREAGLGKLIGTRTWGGLVGISGNPQLIDGGYTSAPTFAFFENNGTWGIEGHGVDPDIEVIDDPALMVGGKDPQLDAAIDHMLDELRANPYKPPARPAFPDRSGMGLRPEDR